AGGGGDRPRPLGRGARDEEVAHDTPADLLEVEVRDSGISLIVEDPEKGTVVRALGRRVDARPPGPVEQLRADTLSSEPRDEDEAPPLVGRGARVVPGEDERAGGAR